MTGPNQPLTIDQVFQVFRWAAWEAIRGTGQAVALGLVLGLMSGNAYFAIAGAFWGVILGPVFGIARGAWHLDEASPSIRARIHSRARKVGGLACLVLAVPCGVAALTIGADFLPVVLLVLGAGVFGVLLGWVIGVCVGHLFEKQSPGDGTWS